MMLLNKLRPITKTVARVIARPVTSLVRPIPKAASTAAVPQFAALSTFRPLTRGACAIATLYRPKNVTRGLAMKAVGGSKKPSASASAPAPPATSAVAAPADPALQLQTVRSDLESMVKQELDRIRDVVGNDHPYEEYIRTNKLEIKFDAKAEDITLRKSLLGYDVKVQMAQAPDPDQEEGQQAGGEENEEPKEPEPGAGYTYSFVTDVTTAGTEAPIMRVYGVSSKDGKCYFEGLTIAQSAAQLTDFPAIDYNDLPTETQDKIADFMDLLKIDDEFAQFLPAVAAEMQRQEHVNQLGNLQKFLHPK